MNNKSSKEKSIQSLFLFLQDIIENPSSYDQSLLDFLMPQSSLSKYENKNLDIVKVGSLNTLKAHANEYIYGGWESLDQKRIQSYKKLKENFEKKSEPSRGSLHDIKIRLENKKDEYQMLLNEVVRLGEQYQNLLEICHIKSRSDSEFMTVFKRHLDRYSSDNSLSVIDNGKKSE